MGAKLIFLTKNIINASRKLVSFVFLIFTAEGIFHILPWSFPFTSVINQLGFSKFRLKNTGPNSSSDLSLTLGQFELFGILNPSFDTELIEKKLLKLEVIPKKEF